MLSLSPHANTFSENIIRLFPIIVFGHRSDINGHHELQNLICKMNAYNERGDRANGCVS